MLSDRQRAEFDERGLVRIAGAFSESDAARMCDRLWEVLESAHGFRRHAPDSWTRTQPTHLGAVGRDGAFAVVGSPPLCAAIDDILGAGAWQRPRHWGGPLVTMPLPGVEWNVPHAQWHMDFPVGGSLGVSLRLKIFSFVAPVGERGGGTVVLAGSHHLVARLIAQSRPGKAWRSPLLREAMLRSHPWLRALMSKGDPGDRIGRFMDAGVEIDGVPVRVVELSGAAGDVVLVHPWVFHAPAPNCGTTPRMMLSGGIFAMP